MGIYKSKLLISNKMKTIILFTLLLVSTQVSASDKQTINYYVESLCPYSAEAMMKVEDAFPKGLLDIANVNIIVSGNAKLADQSSKPYKFTCQHGENECVGNQLETCVNHLAKTKIGALQTITCMFRETYTRQTPTKQVPFSRALPDCAPKDGSVDIAEVNKCYSSAQGNNWQYDAFKATPPHPGVPYVTVDGVTLDDIDQDILTSDPMSWACEHAASDLKGNLCPPEKLSSSIKVQELSANSSKKLAFTFYFESLCPDTVKTAGLVNTAIDNGLFDLAEVKLVTSGNAKVSRPSFRYPGQHDFTCQHGDDECYGNQLQLCMWHHSTCRRGALKTILCMYARTVTHGMLLPQAFAECSWMEHARGLYNMEAVKECALGAEGNALHYAAIQATPAEHTNIPWATVGGFKLSDDDQTMMISDPLGWACANTSDKTAKAKVCGGSVSQKISSLRRKLFE